MAVFICSANDVIANTGVIAAGALVAWAGSNLPDLVIGTVIGVVVLVGGIRSLSLAEDILSKGDADMISMCRPLIREPELIDRWQRGDTAPAKCVSCLRCLEVAQRGEPLECGEERRLQEEAAGGG